MLKKSNITLADGAGGIETEKLVRDLLSEAISLAKTWRTKGIIGLDIMDDSGFIRINEDLYLAITIDSFTIQPIFFKGGSIGKLAVDGTVNDLVVSGATPLAILDAIVAEEGTEIDLLKKAADDMIRESKSLGVAIVGGDFKVMPRGQISGFTITTAGIGLTKRPITDDRIKIGDKIILTGGIGEHGAVIAAHQFGLELNEDAKSDVLPLMSLLPLFEKFGSFVHAARDPTRGGLSMVLNDWSELNGVRIVVMEEKIPIKPWVKGISDLLGIDPLSLASEGRAVIAVESSIAEIFLEEMRRSGFPEAEIIGEVTGKGSEVLLRTRIGGLRILDPPSGIIVPRIC